jgi:hypothetical protein
MIDSILKGIDSALRWCNEKLPRQLQDKVMAAYVGRALSFDIPQLYKNIRYGMRADPLVGRMEYENLDWNEVEKDQKQEDENIRTRNSPMSALVDEAHIKAHEASPKLYWLKDADAHLISMLGEDGPKYAEKLKKMESRDNPYTMQEDLYALPVAEIKKYNRIFESARDTEFKISMNYGLYDNFIHQRPSSA